MTKGWNTVKLRVETIDRLEKFRIHKGGIDEAIDYALTELEITQERLREFLIREESISNKLRSHRDIRKGASIN